MFAEVESVSPTEEVLVPPGSWFLTVTDDLLTGCSETSRTGRPTEAADAGVTLAILKW